MSAENKYTRARQDAFIETYSETGSIKAALADAEISRRTYERWKHDDLYGFKGKYEEATKIIGDELQDIALMRVRNQKPRDSATLLITMLKAFDPEKYDRENKTESEESIELMRKFTEWARKNRKAKANSNKSARDAVTQAEEIMARGREAVDDTNSE